ncbi:MAG: hypothetical protein M1839_005714 [Geoglossum umbratile]|nr:MAG: hypothetical protein M1839_005714 [Geoglossum umbratile]
MASPISVLHLFTDVLAAFRLMYSASNFGPDASTLRCMLKLDEYRLCIWAQNSGLADDMLDDRLNKQLVCETLGQIRLLLVDSKELRRRYGLNFVVEEGDAGAGAGGGAAEVETDLEFLEMANVVRIQNRIVEATTLPGVRGVFKRMRWAAIDREGFERLVKGIAELIQRLQDLLDAANQRVMVDEMRLLHCAVVRMADQIAGAQAFRGASSSLYGETSLPSSAASMREVVLREERPDGSTLESPQILEVDPTLVDNIDGDGRRGSASYLNRPVFLEWKDYDLGEWSGPAVERRVKTLSSFLSSPSNTYTFHSLQCIGYFNKVQQSRYCFLYEWPDQSLHSSQFATLSQLLGGRPPIPSLTDRFRLAANLANTILYLHSCGWLHKNIRSDNVLFFASSLSPQSSNDRPLSSPYLGGYDLARPSTTDQFSEGIGPNAATDIYRHPSALVRHAKRPRYRPTFDIYSLGLILIEIAYWYPLSHVIRRIIPDLAGANDRQISSLQQAFLSDQRDFMAQVAFRMGDVYQGVVKACLSGGTHRSGARDDLEWLFREVVQKLEGCKV